jgi:hypothetical protein
VRLTIAAANGTFSLASTSGLSFTTGDGADDSTVTIEGTLASLNAALDGMAFVPDADFNGAASLTLLIDDLGNSGAGGNLTDSGVLDISVAPVNDAPTLAGSGGSVTYVEDDPALTIDSGISLDDVDDAMLAGATVGIVGYVAGEDLLDFQSQSGIVGTFDGATGILALAGAASVAEYQAALRAVAYLNTSENPNTAARAIRFAVTDGNDSSPTIQRSLSIISVNDAPVHVLPLTQFLVVNGALPFSASTGNQIAVTDADADAGADLVRTTLSATQGVITLAGVAGLTFLSGDGVADVTMVFEGTLDAIEAALDGMTFEPTPTYVGAASIQIDTNDLGHNGGPSAVASNTVAITPSSFPTFRSPRTPYPPLGTPPHTSMMPRTHHSFTRWSATLTPVFLSRSHWTRTPAS